MASHDWFESSRLRVVTTSDLHMAGATDRDITAGVRNGHLVRVRRGHYVHPAENGHLIEAATVGGVLSCISALRDAGVYAFDHRRVHVHLKRHGSRLRAPHDRRMSLSGIDRQKLDLHWSALRWPEDATSHAVGIKDALLQSLYCQTPWHSVASIDSALFQGMVDADAVAEIFDAAPQRYRDLRQLVDARSESGQETILRLIVQRAGYRYEIQHYLRGVGRVDMLVEDILVLEADGRTYHDGWDAHRRDRFRDIGAAESGYPTLRFTYPVIMHESGLVVRAIEGLLRSSKTRPIGRPISAPRSRTGT